jgi:AhpC/TSA family
MALLIQANLSNGKRSMRNMSNRWMKRGLIALGLLGFVGFGVFKFAPYIGTVWRSDPVPLGNIAAGAPAPDFAVKGIDGALHRLSDYRGRTLVLEWTSPTCEFTRNHYATGNMQALQRYAASQGIVWLLVDSADVGRPDHLDVNAAKRYIVDQKASVSGFLIDSDGKLGLTYGAVTTPSVYLIDGVGRIAYQGAIDDNPWGGGTQDKAHNYVLQAIDALGKGQRVVNPKTRSYGCSIKYGEGRRAIG